ncbi:hypothetical protein FYL05_08600 [Lactobacillus salivarius]|jgi:hypothetical protein|uniref:hypothetical protein n=1 Tax=Ligilactobacillus salivarius TaxID=1624 RepID=UPI0009DB42B1|nr:hypothetical protein [Ligilactobacillus salivarius]DAE67877.1 MAG TPA: hypothetical protein [Caudoviricetes sp.]MYU96027.1 hypothetical protein [Ligilactobacillus salivarius]MYY46108.1 hypothetical protein [Ligilactobacillus salivarius]MYY87712.1 hypothetical protein [Ligilactobacillus salivarius]MYY94922.1 hypothetical protein [Ligilactobacillus salivarius]
MTPENYFNLCNLLIKTINDFYIRDRDTLLLKIKNNDLIVTLSKEISPLMLEQQIDNILMDMINIGLINGSATSTKMGPIFTFRGLTSKGMEYISSINSNTIKNKMKKAIHDEGLPITIPSLLKVLGKTIC